MAKFKIPNYINLWSGVELSRSEIKVQITKTINKNWKFINRLGITNNIN